MKHTSGTFTLFVVLNVLWCMAAGGDFIPTFNAPALIIVPCIVTIGAYFVVLWRRPRLTQRQVDSVYYLGFLTTLAVLGVSAYSLTRTSTDGSIVQTAGAQFALGLLATGMGLFFRIFLQNRVATAGSAAEHLNQYVDTIGRLSDRMDDAARNFERMTNETIQIASDTSRKTASAALTNITEALQPAVKDLRTAVSDINRSLKKIDPSQMRSLAESVEGLGSSMGVLSSALPGVRTSIKEFQSEIDKSTKSQAQHASASDAVTSSLGAVAGNLGEVKTRLSSMHDTFKQCEAQFGRTAQAQGGYAQSAEKVAATLQTAATALAGVTAGMNQTGKEIHQLVVNLDAAGLKSLSASLTDAVERLAGMNAEVTAFAKTVGSAHATVGQHMGQLTKGFDVQVQQINVAVNALGDAMVNLSASIRKSVEDAMRY